MIPVETLRMGVREAKPRSDSLTEADSIRRREGAFKFQMIAISTFLFFLYIGMEVSYAGYLLTYAVKSEYLGVDKGDAAWLTSLFWSVCLSIFEPTYSHSCDRARS
eukprot:m.603333 g.603333  ORF g.603333 m.603333 type:complete len:106 (+) comp58103_c0_seq21:711-1028(+)